VCTITVNEQGHTDGVACMELISIPEGEFIASGGLDCALKIWDTAGGLTYSVIEQAAVTSLKFLNGGFLISILS